MDNIRYTSVAIINRYNKIDHNLTVTSVLVS